MQRETIHPCSKRAIYWGPCSRQWSRLHEYTKEALQGPDRWQIDFYTGNSLPKDFVLDRNYDLLMIDTSVVSDEGLDLATFLAHYGQEVGIIAVTEGHSSQLVQIVMTGCIDDVINLGQEPHEILEIMSACCQRRINNSAVFNIDKLKEKNSKYGVGDTMWGVAARVHNIVKSAITCVHVTGESGTGKELVAQMFKEAAGRVPFVSLSCATIPDTLMESAFFGSVRGSFTGSMKDQMGFFESADGGWIFLDEVACLSKSAQAGLLRAIENQEIMRVGDTTTVPLRFRVISATNAPLREMALKGDFRLDLYHRLAEAEVRLPPLRDRPHETSNIIDHLVKSLPGGPYRISSAAKSLLEVHPWSEGNIRQLRNCLRAMTEFHIGGYLTPQSIPKKVLDEACAFASSMGLFNEPEKIAAIPGKVTRYLKAESSENKRSEICINIPTKDSIDFDRLTLELFTKVAKIIGLRNGKFSTRVLAETLGISKSTVSRKLNEATDLGIGEIEDLVCQNHERF